MTGKEREHSEDPEITYMKMKDKEAAIELALHDAKKMAHYHASVMAIYEALRKINKFPRIVSALLTIAIMVKSNER